ncbi:MAG: hypothetical protein CFH22_00321 [Alphaproteobacteria bacterium MarineAlpha5_Bin12]|nr:hypothetical protein [Pelagibacteraceae bacterium]PPR41780.1 MAG: hypothetical protein CFH22_00321 [Alphaproteobacteria bacterium MarineAlpha5_Bin12]|tara:strand:+ start:39803 stop:40915 length:1113 start_codon:yes stop_codon:yes gene_type:complete
MKLLHNYFCLNNILFVFFYILFINSYAYSNEIDGIYSFKDVYIENESNNSLEAKTKGIENSINEKFKSLIKTLTIKNIDYNFIIENFNSDDYLKNVVLNNEIVTEKKYIANINIFFERKKIIDLFRTNRILFSDALSPEFLFISNYNLDGSEILWEGNKINSEWLKYKGTNNQINFNIPNSNNTNKILLSSYDIKNLNIINLNKILDYYKLENLIIFNIIKEYNSEDGKIYFDLNIIYYTSSDNSLSTIYKNKIDQNNLNQDNLFNDLVFISYNEIYNWWKNKTITYYGAINHEICSYSVNDIKKIQQIKNKLISISQIDSILLNSINLNKIYLKIYYYGNFKELNDILRLSNINLIKNQSGCILNYESA